jgi:TonB family protein
MLLAYMLLLRSRPMYRFNRVYLLAATILPFVLPFVQLPLTVQDKMPSIPVLQFRLPEVRVGAGTSTDPRGLSLVSILWLGYGLVCIAIVMYHIWGLLRLRRVVRGNEQKDQDGYVLMTGTGYGPGSFGRYIFFPAAEVNEAILAHERAHIVLHHTRDILFLNFFQAFAWPSLLLGRIKKELKELHEFQADAMANEDRHSYAELLLSSALGIRALPEMHLFIIHPLKRRIMMLQKNGPGSPLKTILLSCCTVLMLGASVLFVQSCNKSSNKSNKGTSVEANTTSKTNGDVIKTPDVMPQFNGDLAGFLGQNIHYPEYAKEKKIEGRVMIHFVVASDGALVNPEAVRSPDTSLTRAAMDVINRMPKWQPARMKDGKAVATEMVLPIVFKLQ